MAWQIDNTHSQVTFSVRHMMVSTVKGQFKVLSGKLEIDEQHPENSWVEAEVDTASIDTRDERRDGHLRSPDFFDAANYPRLTFKSTKVEAAGNHEYRVTGDLTLHGVTRQVTFDAEYSGQLKDAYGMQRAGLSAKATINRKDFGLNWNQALESGGVLVGDKVTIEIDLAAVQAAVAQPA
jgi:polyisoprenoid-binding protein YceI